MGIHFLLLHLPTVYVLSKNMNIVKKNQLKIGIFTAVKNRCISHEHVFVMCRPRTSLSGYRLTG